MPSTTSRAGSPLNPIVTTSTSCPWATSSLQSSWDTGAPPPPIGGNSKFKVRIRTETSQDQEQPADDWFLTPMAASHIRTSVDDEAIRLLRPACAAASYSRGQPKV